MTSPASAADRFSALSGEQRTGLLRRLVEQGRTDAIPAVVPPRDADAPVLLSPAQQDLWVYESLYPETGALNLCCAYHFDRAVDPAKLTAALTVLQDNHDILRTRLSGEPGAVRVDFPQDGPFLLELCDLRVTGGTFAELADEFRRRSFDPGSGGRLIRGLLITVDENRSTLLLALHHIITDWWSFDVLHSEFADAYRAVCEDGAVPRRPHIQYADFACWQRELEAAGVFDTRLDFWQRYLSPLPAPLAVPGACGAQVDFGIAQIPFAVDARTAQAVRELARRHGTTVYGVLISAFAAFAARLTGANDLVLGTPTANREAKGLERVIGYVMNAVPTRWRIGADESFATLLNRFAAEFPQVMANAQVPVGRIVARTAPERSAGRSPLFQWVFMYLPRQESMARLREFSEPERIHTGGEHDFVGIVQDADDGFSGTLEVRTDRYDPAVVRHWADGFAAMLAALVADPDTLATAPDPMTVEDRRRLLTPAAEQTATATLPGLVQRYAATTPDAPALDADSGVLSYGELADRAARLARRLRELGAVPGRIVALALPRSVEAVVAALAVQQTGAAYLPVDPDHPVERIQSMLQDASPVLLVAASGAHPQYAPEGLPVLILEAGAYGGDPLPVRTPAPEEAAYVIYTSGSTGRPKGVVVTHAGIGPLAHSFAERFGIEAADRVLQAGSPAFDISVAEAAMTFHRGATLVVPPAGPLAAAELGDVLRERRITVALLPPALLARTPADDLPELRTLATGADTCPPGLPARWAVGGRRILNAYGPTEATVGITVSDPLPGDGSAPPIGRTIAGARAYVLDRALRPVPFGVLGEMYLAGEGVARGYLGRPGLTAERFVADLYGPPGARMYRSGDLARRRPDGQLDFLGRADEQVKVNGLRIEPGEIEAWLAEHPSLEQAVVDFRDGRLIAYAVPRAGCTVDPDALRTHAALRLPAAMVPVTYIEVVSVPVTATGKADRAALPAPAPLRKSVPNGGAATPAEAALCALYADLLGVREVAPDEDLFEAGGDSITALQLVGRAQSAGLEFTPGEVFTARTPVRLAALARTVGAAVLPDDGFGPVPLTPMMHWWQEQGGTPHGFAMRVLLSTSAGVDAAGIAEALRRLRERHGALRLRVRPGADGAWDLQVPPPDGDGQDLAVRVDTAGMDEDEVRAAAGRAAAETVLDAEGGQMMRGVWFDAGPGRAGRLLLVLHHLAVDGVSLHLVAAELADLLVGREPGAHPVTSVRRWGELLHREARRRTHELPWWEGVLARPEARLLPDRQARGRRSTLSVELSPELTTDLIDRLPAAFHCGPDVVLLTALAAAAARWRGSAGGLLVDVERHGRTGLPEADVTGTVGWFTAQHPVLIDTDDAGDFWIGGSGGAGGESAGLALKQVKEQLRETPGDGLGWGLLRYLVPETADRLAQLPQPDLRFNYLGRIAEDGAVESSEADLELFDATGLPLAHAVELDVMTDGRSVKASWSYDDGALDRAEVGRLAGMWAEALGALAGHAAEPGAGGFTASDFPLVDLTLAQLALLEVEL
ncbi:amino acid adenylation domain-containing protein [Streptomyces sp. NPDC005571]|uniref:amino acid adenylation domain-containing protein n=1 Tax=Streptomyces sp. NPDC005571 TaxID=3156888 RepID=UPI0033AFEF5D